MGMDDRPEKYDTEVSNVEAMQKIVNELATRFDDMCGDVPLELGGERNEIDQILFELASIVRQARATAIRVMLLAGPEPDEMIGVKSFKSSKEAWKQ